MVLEHRTATDQCYKLVTHYEGFYPTRYICPAGVPTIGIGHAIRKIEEPKYATVSLSKDEALDLLKVDLYEAEASVSRLIRVTLEDYQFDALVSFVFNLGGGALQRSTLRSRLNRLEYLAAAEEFPKWCYGGGRILRGLQRRRKSEQYLFLHGVLRFF